MELTLVNVQSPEFKSSFSKFVEVSLNNKKPGFKDSFENLLLVIFGILKYLQVARPGLELKRSTIDLVEQFSRVKAGAKSPDFCLY